MPTYPIHATTVDSLDIANFLGPYTSSGAQYLLGDMTDGFIRVYKSVDGDVPWTVQDSANSPAMTGFSDKRSLMDVVWAGTNITAFYPKQGVSRLSTKTFSTVSNLWGSEVVDSDFDTNSGDQNQVDQFYRAIKALDGKFYIFYEEWLTTFQTLNYKTFSGGVFSAGTILVNGSGTEFNYPDSVSMDASGVMHVYYRKAAAQGITAKLYHITLTTSGVIGAAQLIDAADSNSPTGLSGVFTAADKLVVPAFNSSGLAGVYEGTPISAPVWSAFILVDTIAWGPTVFDFGFDDAPLGGTPDYKARSFLLIDGGTAYLIWGSTDGSTLHTVSAIYYAQSTGSGWGAPTLVFNALGTSNEDGLFGISAVITDGFLDVIADINCTGVRIFAPVPVAAPPSIICDNPPLGEVGVAYSHFFPASGGTPPYTWSISGLVPPGLTLNTSTGELAGIPTAYGTFVFTVTVTDSLDQSADVTCSITILAPPSPEIICDNPPQGEIGVFYTHAFPASSGVPPYAWAITGTVPPGLTFNTATGVLSGTPTASGVFDFTVSVTDSLGRTVSVDCEITIIGSTGDCPGGARNDVHPYTTPASYKL